MDDLTSESLATLCTGKEPMESLRTYLRGRALNAYRQKRAEVNKIEPDLMLQAERYFLLRWTDSLWKEHLQVVEFLQQAVGLRGYAQREPLVEFKLDSYNLFLRMTTRVRREVVYNLFEFQPTKLLGSK